MKRPLSTVFLICAALVLSSCSHHPIHGNSPGRGLAYAKKIDVPGVPKFGKVSEWLYRGAQPREEGFAELKKLGITTILDLRGEDLGKRAWERQRAEALGMHFELIRASGWTPPSDEQMAQFLSLVAKRPREKIFMHCWLGDDRTGVFVAAYRMAFEKWTPEEAIDEMYFFHFKGFWHPAMKKYIREFPERLRSSPGLGSFGRTGPPAPKTRE